LNSVVERYETLIRGRDLHSRVDLIRDKHEINQLMHRLTNAAIDSKYLGDQPRTQFAVRLEVANRVLQEVADDAAFADYVSEYFAHEIKQGMRKMIKEKTL
jgi:hypothetical protein